MPVFDFIYRLEELISDLDMFLPEDAPLSICLGRDAPAATTPADLEQSCGADESSWLYTGLLYLQKRQGANTEYCFRRLADLNPQRWGNDITVVANLATAMMQQERYDEALAMSARSLELAPGNLQVRKSRIEILEKARRPDREILEQVLEALALAPDDPDLMEKKEQYDSSET